MKRIIYILAVFVPVLIFGVSVHHSNFKKEIKLVALTFDDGPYATSTEKILSILENKGVTASFFLVGEHAKKYPELVKREVADGFVIGNHSYSHSRDLPIEPTTTLKADLDLTEHTINSITNLNPHIFRYPFGSTSPQMEREVSREGYVKASWDVDPNDWKNTNSSTTIINYVIEHVKPGDIILLHDGHEFVGYSRENTVEALPTLIDDLKKEGYIFVTVDKILNTNAYILK